VRPLALILAFVTAVPASAAGGSPKPVDYGRDVRPILAARCFTCHGPDASSRAADLRLDDPHEAKRDRDGVFAIAAGNPDASEVIRRIESHDPDERMPPEGNPLTGTERELLRRWIEEGAAWSDAWSWRPVAPPELPPVIDTSWSSDPLDRFVLARLESAGVPPAPRADPRTLLRRATYDLIGLPPEPADLERFAADPSPEAFAGEISRLLAHPGFGETWGRHWLDLVRYAETYGHEFDYPIPNAWRYRDAVIRAFNADVPYDRFVMEHLAGDLLEPRRIDPATGLDEGRILTGFWWLTQGTHAPVDVAKDEAERIDNQIDVLGKAFLGVTAACARCHDHKFDAITQRDYYGLSAHLKRSRRAIVELDPGGKIEAERAAAIAGRRSVEARLLAAAGIAEDRDPTVGPAAPDTDFRSPMPEGFRSTGQAFARDASEIPRLEPRGDRAVLAPSGVATSLAAGEAFAGTLRSPSFAIERRFLHQRVRGAGAARVIIDGYHLDEQNPLLFEGFLKRFDSREAFATLTWDLDRYRGRRAHLEWADEGPGFVEIDWIATGDAAEPPTGTDAEAAAIGLADADRAELEAALRRTSSEPIRILAIEDGTTWPEFVRQRGNPAMPGEPVEPGHVASLDAAAAPAADRLALARRIASPDHPLTARVFANRAWHHLTGRGLVESVDDFGALGTPPSDPELLDHLADGFRRDWSVKRLVRSIVLSSTYAMSAAMSARADALAHERDPRNELPHRANLRRLPAEALRDSMLVLAGRFDPTAGGPGVATHLTEFMDGRGRPGASGPVDGNGRRSVYLEVRRNFPDPFLSSFDLPIPTSPVGRRNRSNVPGQALAMLNAPLVHEMARLWGERVAAEPGTVAERTSLMTERAFGRPARPDELERMVAFVQEDAASRGVPDAPDAAAFAGLAHVLFNAKEFLVLD
jgi:cytochrome c553